ncbi:MAG: M23 family metallopeptidase [Ancrocorticia sp.]
MKLAATAGAALLLSSLVFLSPTAGPTTQENTDVRGGAVVVRDATSGVLERDDDVFAKNFDWPSGGEVPVVRGFDPPESAWLTGHRGVDLEMAEGADVFAAGAGRVVYAGRLNDRNLISIEHEDGLRTTYEPVSPAVNKGDVVMKGQVIGSLEAGHVTDTMTGASAVLHWGAKYPGDRYINPLSLLRLVPIRLWE